MHQIEIPDCYKEKFELVYHEEFKLRIPFTQESWNGRMKACLFFFSNRDKWLY